MVMKSSVSQMVGSLPSDKVSFVVYTTKNNEVDHKVTITFVVCTRKVVELGGIGFATNGANFFFFFSKETF